MERLFDLLRKTSKGFAVIAGISLTFMMCLTVADVVMRAFGSPIMGTYEIVGFILAAVIGFSIPVVTLNKKHIYMDFVVDNLTKRNKAVMITLTRILNILLFLLIGYALFSIGNEFRISGEVSPTIRLPFYPLAFGVGICCFVECLVFFYQIVQSWRASHE